MKVINKLKVNPIQSDYGEAIYELIDAAKGNAKNHSVAYVEMAPGKSSKPHFHPIVEESYYILSGEAKMVIDTEEQQLNQGDAVVIPIGSSHQIINNSEQLLCYLAICSPAWAPDCSVYEGE